MTEQHDAQCGCGDTFPARSYGAGFLDAMGHCENCEAGRLAGREPPKLPARATCWINYAERSAHLAEQQGESWEPLYDRDAVAAAVAAEREACAKLCDQRAAMYMPVNRDAVGRASQLEARICADAIRERGAAPAGAPAAQPISEAIASTEAAHAAEASVARATAAQPPAGATGGA